MIGKAAVLAIIAVLCVQHVAADIYLHSLRGGNNRLDEPSRDRNNGNRLWDSQNNNRGGSNHGTFGREYFYEGSTISIEWTSQHSCGHQNNYCEIILQYYCDNNQTRDGLTTNTIPTDQTQCMNYNCDTDTTYGRHESYQSYMDCVYRSRNKGLWTSSQDLQGNGAIYTRQNANGNRHGYECPEERDYYPYWHPNQWVDIAIFTTEPSRCPAYQAASQNVSPRSYCLVGQDMINKHVQANTYDGFIPITQKECEQNVLGTWVTVPSLQQQYPNANIQAPNCTAAPWSRDNHLGNGLSDQHPDGFPVGFNWTIPAGYNGQSCVFRIRYNVSTAETHDNNGAWASDTSVQAGALNSTHNYTRYTLPNNINADPNNNDNDPLAYHYPANWDVWSKYKLTTADVAENFNPTAWGLDDPLGIKDTNGQIEGGYSSRGYVLSNYPVVDIFGSWFSQQGASPAINYKLRLALAIDTSQFGRTFEDRTHTFSIQPRPSFIPANAKIWNLGVRGKRGNIVQVFPGVEYDFTFNSLHVTQGDFVHFQWTGSNTNPNNNAGQGTQGTDRSNIILLRSNPVTENLAANAMKPFAGHTGSWKQTYPQDITQDDFVGFNTQQRRTLARNGIYTPIVNIGPYQVNANAGNIYNYVSTRNHAFTNRDQKAQIVVQPAAAAYTQIDTTHMLSQMVTPDGNAWVRFYPDPTGFTTGAQLWLDTDDQGRVVINPPFFDVVNGQKVMLDMRYDHGQNIMVHVPYILQSDYSDFSYYQTLTTSYNGGIASAAITRGGYYVCDVQPNIGAVVGIVIGVLAFAAICVFVYMQIRKRFRYGAKKTELMSTNTEMSSTSV